MIVSKFAYEMMCKVYGEEWVQRFYTPYTVIRR